MSFIHYVSTRHAEILGVNMPAEQRDRCEAAVASANPPPVTVEESERDKMLRDLEAHQESIKPAAPVDRPRE